MIKKKICTLGGFAVGKTSLIRRFVESIFTDKYLTSVGVKVDKKVVEVQGQEMMLMLWDVQGEDGLHDLPMHYIRGATGYIFVIDGTRATTLQTAVAIEEKLREAYGALPMVCAVNKCDLADEWELSTRDMENLQDKGWKVIQSSAKDGTGVEDLFLHLAEAMLEEDASS